MRILILGATGNLGRLTAGVLTATHPIGRSGIRGRVALRLRATAAPPRTV
jgi:uncharacterized protein YbjT (DUF2867 family)